MASDPLNTPSDWTPLWLQRLASWQTPVAALVLALVLGVGLGGPGLLDPWEMDRVAVARRMAGPARLLVVDGDQQTVQRTIAPALAEQVALQVVAPAEIASANNTPARMLALAGRARKELAHGAIVDLDSLVGPAPNAAKLEPVATSWVGMTDGQRGFVGWLVTSAEPALVRDTLALARARRFAESWKVGFLQAFTEGQQPELLAPLFRRDLDDPTERIVAPGQLAADVAAHAPRPMWLPLHKKDNDVGLVAWLEPALTAWSLRIFGPTEAGARAAGALLAWLAGLVAVVGARRLWGNTAGWLTLVVYATLPMAIGMGRVVTFESAAPLGLALYVLGLAQAAASPARRGRDWPLWVAGGFAVLLLGRGLGGAAMAGGIALAYLLGAAGAAKGPLLASLGTLAAFGLAAALILSDAASPLLRSLRFTQWPFSAGLDAVHRDFAWFVGQAGFALFPWGAAVALGLSRLLQPGLWAEPAGDDGNAGATSLWTEERRVGAVLLLGVAVPYAVVAILIRKYHHFVVPVAPVAAVAAALLLLEVLAGRLAGRFAALFAFLSTLLLHREIRKGADAVTRFFAFDPPMDGAAKGGELAFPAELAMPKPLHLLSLLLVVAFCIGAARPMGQVREWVVRLRSRRATAWALTAVLLAWTLDALISLGTKLDVTLKTQATLLNYPYDRLWVMYQDTRPEVIAGAVSLALLLLAAGLAAGIERARLEQKKLINLLFQLGTALQWPVVALALVAVGAVAALLGGLSLHQQLRPDAGWGGAVLAGALRPAFWAPLLFAGLIAGLRGPILRGSPALPAHDERRLLSPFWSGIAVSGAPLAVWLVLLGVGGLGVGASQAAGTWNMPLLAGAWLMWLPGALLVIGRAQYAAEQYALPILLAAKLTAANLMGLFVVRWLGEMQLQGTPGEGWKYLAKVVVASPDAAGLLGLAVVLLINREALGRERLRAGVERLLGWAAQLERPRPAAAALALAAVCFSTGYAFSLLPGLSVHFSQKHLLQRIAQTGATATDAAGVPRTFAHGAGKSTGSNNFYLQSMPLVDDRAAALALLAGKNVATRVTDNAQGGVSRVLAIPGWDPRLDADGNGQRDVPAFFGVAQAVQDTKITFAGVQWQPGQWDGAQVLGPEELTATVVSNDQSSLTLSAPLGLVAGDPERGALVVQKAQVLPRDPSWQFAAASGDPRYLVLPKEAFSELNFAFRQANDGAFIPVADAASSRLVLAASRLPAGQADQNWIKKAMISEADFQADKSIRRMFANFDNSIHLLGWKVAEPSTARSQKYKMTLYWKVVKPTTTSWKLFMHPHPLNLDRWPLTNPEPSEDDNKPCGGCFSTAHWRQGDLIADTFEQEVPLGTPSGPNEVILGWYNPGSDTRMTVLSASGPGVVKHGDNRVTIGHLQVR